MSVPRLTSFNYVTSEQIPAQLSIKVGGVDGKPPLPLVPAIRDEFYRGDFQQRYADLKFCCYLWDEDQVLTLPVSTSYRCFTSRWQWGERLLVPMRICDIPRGAALICEIREVVSSCDEVVLGGAAVPIYDADSVLQCGLIDIRIHMGVSEPRKLLALYMDKASVKDEMTQLAKLVKQHHSGEIEKVDWLDRLTFREVEHVNERTKQQCSSYHLSLEFPPVVCNDTMLSVVHAEPESPASPATNDLCLIHDPEVLLESLVEQKQHKLSRPLRYGPEAKSLKPNPSTKHYLSQIIDYPPTRSLTSDEEGLIWMYRYYLCRFKKALPKFLRCIDWDDEQEVDIAMDLVQIWDNIDVEDALGLLSTRFTHSSVRLYAVKRLSDANDDDLRLYLLQLVQALKFEATDSRKDSLSPLGEFLIARACKNIQFGNYFYWYLVVECEDNNEADTKLYRHVIKCFSNELKKRGEKGERQRNMFRRQSELITQIRSIMQSLGKGIRPQKIENLRNALRSKQSLVNFEETFPLPLDPSITICGIIPEKATLFKSSLMPARLAFRTSEGKEYVTIFKNGDDLRQDQLILQIIELMDKLLCKENLNLKLKPYRALATGPNHGFIQFVESMAVASVIQQEGTILNYLTKQSRDGKNIDPEIMDTYIRSCAGYCVITYILGVGDRHLDNLMLTKHGHLLHVDFGYILGRDPKPFPPPMKLSKEMVEVMGGVNSPEYARFREHCYNAFLILRRSASLILNLFSLMLHANIPDIASEPDAAIRKVQDKFCLDLSEEEAVQQFQQIIDDSVSALFSALWENVHKWAQYFRR